MRAREDEDALRVGVRVGVSRSVSGSMRRECAKVKVTAGEARADREEGMFHREVGGLR